MKKKLTLLLVLFINISYFCFSQAPQHRLRRVDSLQGQYLNKELALTPEESEKFWPVYNNYKSEIRSIRAGDKTDQIAVEEKLLNIRKKYKDDFKSILGSDERVNKLFVAEKNFREMLRKELLKRKINGQTK